MDIVKQNPLPQP